MQSLLILYNPYYQHNIIESHIEILRKEGLVAFGKVKSKLKNVESAMLDSTINDIYQNTSKDSPLQLFLTDYANLFVAKVIKVECVPSSSLGNNNSNATNSTNITNTNINPSPSSFAPNSINQDSAPSAILESSLDSSLESAQNSFLDSNSANLESSPNTTLESTQDSTPHIPNTPQSHSTYSLAPSYYKKKGLEVEAWFIIEDMRELIRDDFSTLRDSYLANLTTPHYGNHTYAIYGNTYIYPLLVTQKSECNYFESEGKHYPNIYKSKEELEIKQNLSSFVFGELIHCMHPDTLDNLISAEIEYQSNRQNPLYDFSSVAVKYSKVIEIELYSFMKEVFRKLSNIDSSILDISYNLQSRGYTLKDIFTHKPNLGTYKYLLRLQHIKDLIEVNFRKHKHYFHIALIRDIDLLQDIRNESVHGKAATLQEAKTLRENVLGIKSQGILSAILTTKQALLEIK